MEPADTQLATTALTSSSCQTAVVGGSGLGAGTSGGGTQHGTCAGLSPTDAGLSPGEHTGSGVTSKEEDDSSNAASSDCKSPGQRYVNLLFNICTFVY